LIAVIVVMSVVVLSGEELKHVPPAAPSFVVLHSFAGPPTDGAHPYAGLLRDAGGNLYGTTAYGGAYHRGAAFELSPTGTETVLQSFCGADGAYPYAGLIRDAAGNLYGTTNQGGAYTGICANEGGCGVVFKLGPAGIETVLHSFTGANGIGPYAGLVQDAGGNLYGTAAVGGTSGEGVVFKVSPIGTETILHSFTGGADGAFPAAGLVRDGAGNLYGTTAQGAESSRNCDFYSGTCGVVFKLSPTGTETVLHSFAGYPTDGGVPFAGLIRDAAGNLYGTTNTGGASSTCTVGYGLGCGVVFKLSPSGTETVLHSFTGGADGANPFLSGLVQDAAGNLYGTTAYGGATGTCNPPVGCGVVFKLSAAGTETVLHSFTGGADGAFPQAGLIQDAAGNLYGTASSGGPGGFGVVFRLTP
jgi:uncharacterized repeat protein (TIGR03803 family)